MLDEGDLPELLHFKKELEAEIEARFREEEERLDEELAEAVALRRIEVEREIARRRASHLRKARDLTESLRLELLRDLRRRLAQNVQDLAVLLEKELFKELESMKGTPRYERALNRFVREGLERVGDQALVQVVPGEGQWVDVMGNGVVVEETLESSEGGCRVIRWPEGDHVIDNSLRSRWGHLVREVTKEISHRVTPLVDGLEEAL